MTLKFKEIRQGSSGGDTREGGMGLSQWEATCRGLVESEAAGLGPCLGRLRETRALEPRLAA